MVPSCSAGHSALNKIFFYRNPMKKNEIIPSSHPIAKPLTYIGYSRGTGLFLFTPPRVAKNRASVG